MIYVAIILATIATCMTNYSMYIQKRELNNLPRLEGKNFFKTLKSFFTCEPWVAAQLLAMAGHLDPRHRPGHGPPVHHGDHQHRGHRPAGPAGHL